MQEKICRIPQRTATKWSVDRFVVGSNFSLSRGREAAMSAAKLLTRVLAII
jgi:hypothetical protein